MRVALTYDDGPSSWTPAILDLLEAHGAVATFYVLGTYIEGREDLLRWMNDIGCEIGPHGHDHTNLKSISEAEAQLQLVSCAVLIDRAVPNYEIETWRAPHHSRHPQTEQRVREEQGWTYAGTNNDPGDWYVTQGAEIERRVLAELRDGSIINLHDGVPPHPSEKCTVDRSPTVTATALLLETFATRGVQTVTAAAILDA